MKLKVTLVSTSSEAEFLRAKRSVLIAFFRGASFVESERCNCRNVKLLILKTPQKHLKLYHFKLLGCWCQSYLDNRFVWATTFVLSRFWPEQNDCLNSAPLVSHASLQTTRPSGPSKVLSAIRLWAEFLWVFARTTSLLLPVNSGWSKKKKYLKISVFRAAKVISTLSRYLTVCLGL